MPMEIEETECFIAKWYCVKGLEVDNCDSLDNLSVDLAFEKSDLKGQIYYFLTETLQSFYKARNFRTTDHQVAISKGIGDSSHWRPVFPSLLDPRQRISCLLPGKRMVPFSFSQVLCRVGSVLHDFGTLFNLFSYLYKGLCESIEFSPELWNIYLS